MGVCYLARHFCVSETDERITLFLTPIGPELSLSKAYSYDPSTRKDHPRPDVIRRSRFSSPRFRDGCLRGRQHQ